MGKASHGFDASTALLQLAAAAEGGLVSPSAAEHIRGWLTEPRYVKYAPLVAEHVEAQRWKDLDDVFWTVIPFGTGGRRGKMYPIGTNAINERTIGESAQGLADYVRQVHGDKPLACAIAYDTRHRSRDFGELCAEVMVAAGFKVWFLDGYRSTPELSFLVRYKQCDCGIMVTASHNPPSDNAVKAYWSTGGQLLPPHDEGVIQRVMNAATINRTAFPEALAGGQVVPCQEEVDEAFIEAVLEQSHEGPRDLKVIYSPLHGVGTTSVLPTLERAGFKDVELFGPHAEPNGDFPNVPGHVSNPENVQVFDSIIARAQQVGADLILVTDPDADRVGVAAPLQAAPNGPWSTITGNQIGALLTEYVLERRKADSRIPEGGYVVKTLVTTELIRRIADQFGVRTFGDLQVGCKYIAGVIDEQGPEKFIFGAEESHGYLVGTYARDKDATAASMLLAELAARLKTEGQTLHQKLDVLQWQYGCHLERQVSFSLPGSEGMDRMAAMMARFRGEPPQVLAGLKVAQVRDYLELQKFRPGERREPLEGPRGDMVMIDLEADGTYVAVRPSGTEPKVKFYTFAYEPPEQIADLQATKAQLAVRLEMLVHDLTAFAQAT